MTHNALILESLAYRRHTGASLSDIRTYTQIRQDRRCTQHEDRVILSQLHEAGTIYSVGEKWFLTAAAYRAARGPAVPPDWEDSDAWILLAVLCYRDSPQVQLQEILAAADFINHAIPTIVEAHGALNRLVAGRLLKANRGGYVITQRSRELHDKVQATCARAVQDQLNGLRHVMACPCCGVRLKAVRWGIQLDDTSFGTAVKTYLQMTKAARKRT